jgi:hypothetical protein
LSTRPFKTGTILPANCLLGEVFFKSDATPGANLYLCVASNSWLQVAGSGGGGGASSFTAGLGLFLSGSTFSIDFATVPGLAAPNGYSNLNDFSAGQIRIQNGTGIPSASHCSSASNVGKLYARSDALSANSTLYLCSQTASGSYLWELVQGSGAAGCWIDLAPMGGGNSSAGVTTSWTTDSSESNVFPSKSAASGAVVLLFQDAVPAAKWMTKKVGFPRNCTGSTGYSAVLEWWAAGSGNQKFDVRYACTAPGSAGNSPSYTTVSGALKAVTGATSTTYTDTFPLNLSGCTPGSSLWIGIARDPAISGNGGGGAFISNVAVYK